MLRYVLVSVGSGILFGLMDGVINANPMARKLYSIFEPIARKSINIPAGLIIDLIYGFALAAGFLLLRDSLPGESGIVKGLAFAGLVWFARVVMQVATQWMMFAIPPRALLYTLGCGLLEMMVLGALYGLALPT